MKKGYTMFDYLEWRGDLTFRKSPLNEVDNLIFSMSTYLHYEGIVPPLGDTGAISFPDAVTAFMKRPKEERYLGLIVPKETEFLAVAAADSARFHHVTLSHFENFIDEKNETQFSAVTFRLPDGTLFVAFRGTDDTVVGWKEDVNLAYMDSVPAEKLAVRYLETVAKDSHAHIYLGGHSKGGHLALYAASHAAPDIRSRIVRAYNNDGPGFAPKIIESENFCSMAGKLITFIPQSSIVGELLHHDDHFHIIKSDKKGLLQHDPFSWEVHGSSFVYLKDRSRFGKRTARGTRVWLDQHDLCDRSFLVNTLFSLIDATKYKTLTAISQNRFRAFTEAHKALRRLSHTDRLRFLTLSIDLLAEFRIPPTHTAEAEKIAAHPTESIGAAPPKSKVKNRKGSKS